MCRFRVFTLLAVTTIHFGIAMPANASEIRFVENFALAQDREKALKLLVPGSEDYFYFNSLHLQNTEQFSEVEQLLKRWIKQHGNSSRLRQIQHRQALLTYAQNPKQSLTYLQSHLNLRFNHQREQINQKPNLPTTLDPSLIDRERLSKLGFKRHRNLDAFSDSALDWLIKTDLNPVQRRHLLERLTRPDYANLPDLVVKDLKHKGSRGFGSLNVHRMLLLEQLEACLKDKPDLLNNTPFVHAYLGKLVPSTDVDWENDDDELDAYLNRLWTFVDRLEPVHNSLKAHVLFHKLALSRKQGKYDKRLFMQYLRIPRNVGYLPRPFRDSAEAQRFSANLGQDYAGVTQLPPVHNDEPLVRDYLSSFFEKENSTKAYQPFVAESYLKELFAETKIVNGLGDAEQYYAMLSPEKYRALRDRVDLVFAMTNQLQFDPNDPVSLDLFVKNVDTLIVKVYEINTHNYYRQLQREVNTDVNLDGLVANHEETHEYSDGPLRRVRRHFEFPQLRKPGTYVIDFIGNGQSSRAVVRKGRLQFVEQTIADGHVFNVLDERDALVSDASLWIAGHEYHSDGNGDILVPFTNQPGRAAITLTADGRSSLHFFRHQAENYKLTAGMYVDRESLIHNQKATLIVRPSLKVNGTPVSVTNLTDVRLMLTSTDHDGTVTTKTVDDFELFEDRESEYVFQVPSRLATVTFTLHGTVPSNSTGTSDSAGTTSATGKERNLSDSLSFDVNGIERSDKIDDLFITKVGDQYLMELLGRTGEVKANRPVQLQIQHRDFTNHINVALQTDENGRIQLGQLTDVETLVATSPSGQRHRWQPQADRFTYQRTMHAVAGKDVLIPYLGNSEQPMRDELSILELRDTSFAKDHFDRLSIRDGYVVASKLPPGDFDLWLKRANQHIRVLVTKGKETKDYAFGPHRHLELRNQTPMQIASIEANDEKVTIRLSHSNPFARVHVFATRFEPAHDAFALMSRVRDAALRSGKTHDLQSLYLAGRNIGDEYQYILDRRYAEKFPGNMLERPSLLLNPWDIRSTDTSEQQAEDGEDFGLSDDEDMAAESQSVTHGGGSMATEDGFPCYNFLASPSVTLANLIPDKNGVLTIDVKHLRGRHQLQVVAIDPLTTVRRSLALKHVESKYQDQRLIVGLDPAKHFTQQKRISIIKEGETFRLNDITSSQFAAYDSLESIYNLYRTLSDDAHLAEFDFILRWPEMDDNEKRDKYSEYACHELSHFIARKDPKFFDGVVRPYLTNKMHKTFMDEWLLDRDLQFHAEPWNYARLNSVERILLGQRIDGESVYAKRHINETFELIPPNPDRWNHLFGTALRGQSLASNDRFGVAGRALQQLSERRAKFKKSIPEPRASAAATRSAGGGSSGGGSLGGGADGFASSSIALDALANEATVNESLGRELSRMQRGGLGIKQDSDDYKREYFFDRKSRGLQAGQFFRKLDKTKEWVENNYYRLPIQQQTASLVSVNAFWNDFANHPGVGFLSTEWADASRNFTEMMFALSVLDLPFHKVDHEVVFEGIEMTLTAKSPVIVVSEQVRAVGGRDSDEISDNVRGGNERGGKEKDTAGQGGDSNTVLVSQNFYRHGERHQTVNGEQVDNFVTGEFLTHTLYGGQVVVTNTSSTRQKIDVLLQVPVGAVPAMNSRATSSVHVELQPYHTQTLDYHFYFPAAGEYQHFPVHVAQGEELLASAEPRVFDVVDQLTEVDQDSWDYVSQFSSDEDVRTFLESHNIQDIDLGKIAFRMRDKQFFGQVLELLSHRHMYHQTLWSYGVHHNDVLSTRQFLQNQDRFVNECGDYLDSPLLTSDPIVRRSYEHMDYKPLVNARAHPLGQSRRILNNRFHAQYHRLMHVLSQRRALDAEDLMSVTYYLLLQDRIGEAIAFFGRVNADELETRLQYDYFTAYLDCYSVDPQQAASIVAKYDNYPVTRWREAFASIRAMLDEVAGKGTQVVDNEDRNQQQNQLAEQEPNFEFKIDSGQISLTYQNIENVQINFYSMDLELLFSRNPFAQESSDQFSLIRPNETQSVRLPSDKSEVRVDLPSELRASNVLIEVVAGGKTKSETYYANSLNVRINENYGMVRVTSRETDGARDQPEPTVYVKAYARMQDGSVRFYKDGYTDLRGKFDYASLNTNELENVDRFSLLVMSEERGAVVREASPPKR